MTALYDKLSQLIDLVTTYYGMTPDDVHHLRNTDCRDHKYTTPKHVIYWAAYYYTKNAPAAEVSISKVAKFVSGNHHATVFHAVKKINGRMEVDPSFRHHMHNFVEYMIGNDSFWTFLIDYVHPARSPKGHTPSLTRHGFPIISYLPLSRVKFGQIPA
jgi:hypothetical protein